MIVARVPGSNDRCDRYGVAVDNAKMQGNGWKVQHDSQDRLVFLDTLRAGVPGEWQPREIFRNCLPQDDHAHYGMIPDARLRLDLKLRGRFAGVMDFLMDTKTIHRGGVRYRARAAQRRPCGAVQRRARDVAEEMEKTAREKDELHNGVPRESGRVGPVLAALRAFPPTQGVAWGAYGESSEHVATLVDVAARGFAEKRWRVMGARNMAEAVGYLKGMLWRRWGCNALFAAARLRVSRMSRVGLPAAAAERQALRDGDGLGDAWLGPTAFEADEAGYGVLRMARGAPVRPE